MIKSTAIDPRVVDADGVYRKTGPARVFTRERDAIAAIKGKTSPPIVAGDVIVLVARGPLGSGMEETYQVTSALKYLEWGREVAVITDARFSASAPGRASVTSRPRPWPADRSAKFWKAIAFASRSIATRLVGSIDLVGDASARIRRRRGGTRAGRAAVSSAIWRPTRSCRTTRDCGPPCSASAAARGPAACTTSTASSACSKPANGFWQTLSRQERVATGTDAKRRSASRVREPACSQQPIVISLTLTRSRRERGQSRDGKIWPRYSPQSSSSVPGRSAPQTSHSSNAPITSAPHAAHFQSGRSARRSCSAS